MVRRAPSPRPQDSTMRRARNTAPPPRGLLLVRRQDAPSLSSAGRTLLWPQVGQPTTSSASAAGGERGGSLSLPFRRIKASQKVATALHPESLPTIVDTGQPEARDFPQHLRPRPGHGAARTKLGTPPRYAAPYHRGKQHNGGTETLAPDLCDTGTSRNTCVR
ncbi:unnamed protein product [Spodoptera exigua]|nr:unnamed protein product [Spodoptera exigua]